MFNLTAAAQSYKRLKDDNTLSGELSYALPKTAFVLEIPVTYTVLSRSSAYQNYTDADQIKYFTLKYGFNEKKYKLLNSVESFALSAVIADDSIKCTAIGVRDAHKVFYVSSNSGWNKNQGISFTYGNDGVLSEGEGSFENKTFDVVVSALSGIVSIVGSVFKGAAIAPVRDPSKYKIEVLENALQQFDDLNTMADYEIFKDRKAHFQKNYDELFAHIFYLEKKKTIIYKLVYVPDTTNQTGKTLDLFFALDDGTLIVNKNLANYILPKGAKDTSTMKPDSYKVHFGPITDQPSTSYSPWNDASSTGFAFNVPLKSRLGITNDKGKVVYLEDQKLSQWGIVSYINTKRKSKHSYVLDPVTGELKKITVEGKAILVDQVTAASTAAGNLVTTVKGESDDTKLENEVKRLENEKKKRDLIKDLNN
ncbi:hypothetical protein OI18_06390 [Flavihumibacter solisilvae]|uniref:Uncharacterized protein n=1 Tax=Flavihumibacter solisilvae TaxID=1349421 RepID=A0A0C1L7L3_9BACT|nr:hypothetical protein OI18_06390 [Flavihumibacter solisilvae]